MTGVEHQKGRLILGVYDPACLVSLSGLTAAVGAMVLAVQGIIELALVGLIVAGIADLFDGVVARRLQRDSFEKQFGVQLDTTIDVVAFVATPVVISLGAVVVSWPVAICLAWFTGAGVVRLAHFNTLSIQGIDQSTYHRGLPVTYSALILPLAFIFRGTISVDNFQILLVGSLTVMGFLFLINAPVPKPRGLFYIFLPLLALCLTVYWVGRYLQTLSAI